MTTTLLPGDAIAEHLGVIKQMEPFVEAQLSWLQPIKDCWQPSDVLPLTDSDWQKVIQDLRERARALSNAVLVVLVGDTVTEEALPSYQTMTNRHAGITDESGASASAWAKWTRGWTAEENRHGQLLTLYLTLSGRVNMRAMEMTTQHLLRNGFDPQTANDPYKGLIYTSFQERATRVSHGNVARLANKSGEPMLGKICNLVAGDEARHEEVYKRFVAKLFELDPSGTMTAFAEMMKTKIVMPGSLMTDGQTTQLFEQFSTVAQRIGVYTAQDYAQILQHLVEHWKISQLTGLSSQATEAQAYVCRLSAQCPKLAERVQERTVTQPEVPFSWIFNRKG